MVYVLFSSPVSFSPLAPHDDRAQIEKNNNNKTEKKKKKNEYEKTYIIVRT